MMMNRTSRTSNLTCARLLQLFRTTALSLQVPRYFSFGLRRTPTPYPESIREPYFVISFKSLQRLATESMGRVSPPSRPFTTVSSTRAARRILTKADAFGDIVPQRIWLTPSCVSGAGCLHPEIFVTWALEFFFSSSACTLAEAPPSYSDVRTNHFGRCSGGSLPHSYCFST
ncbi:hypothetical protein BJ508DRAFT_29685 [Ascobolus immersus RN42]|uniref:Uncharacterized protein n=1 Tax=Ascobolus immersus RN42 TaxID=1160509 RepID=A0A3N4HNK2_ASCIM|nr:hypothetical protein BJ508DRAFT_29685 [Ascobolus immersus RN42]